MNRQAIFFILLVWALASTLFSATVAILDHNHAWKPIEVPTVTMTTTTITVSKYIYFDHLYFKNVQINDSIANVIATRAGQILYMKEHNILTIPSLTISISSGGGFVDGVVVAGTYMEMLRDSNISVIFNVTGPCYSGCALLSSYASRVFVSDNSTFGFAHTKFDLGYSLWEKAVQIFMHNKGWSHDYAEVVMQGKFTAQKAIELKLADGLLSK